MSGYAMLSIMKEDHMDKATEARLASLEQRVAMLESLVGTAVRQPPKAPQGIGRR